MPYTPELKIAGRACINTHQCLWIFLCVAIQVHIAASAFAINLELRSSPSGAVIFCGDVDPYLIMIGRAPVEVRAYLKSPLSTERICGRRHNEPCDYHRFADWQTSKTTTTFQRCVAVYGDKASPVFSLPYRGAYLNTYGYKPSLLFFSQAGVGLGNCDYDIPFLNARYWCTLAIDDALQAPTAQIKRTGVEAWTREIYKQEAREAASLRVENLKDIDRPNLQKLRELINSGSYDEAEDFRLEWLDAFQNVDEAGLPTKLKSRLERLRGMNGLNNHVLMKLRIQYVTAINAGGVAAARKWKSLILDEEHPGRNAASENALPTTIHTNAASVTKPSEPSSVPAPDTKVVEIGRASCRERV